MKKTILALLLTLLSTNAMAEWTQVFSDKKLSIYVHLQSVQITSKTVKIWALYDYTTPNIGPNNTPFLSMKSFDEYDCSQRTSRGLAHSFHKNNMGMGESAHTSSTPASEWTPVSPESVSEYLWKIACNEK